MYKGVRLNIGFVILLISFSCGPGKGPVGGFKRGRKRLSTFSTDSPGELDVLVQSLPPLLTENSNTLDKSG